MSSVTSTQSGVIDAKKSASTPRVAAYLSTTAVTGLNIVAALGVSSILSRTWPKADFLLFTTLNRYLSLLYCLVSLSLGFGLVQLYRSNTTEKKNTLLSSALLIVAGLATLLLVITQWYSQEISAFFGSKSLANRWAILAASLWVIGQSTYHVVLSYQRGLGKTRAANTLMFIVKTVLVLLISSLAWTSRSVSVAAYYGWIGLAILVVSFAYLWQLRSTWKFTPNLHNCGQLSSISWSRSFESILRHAVLPIAVTMLYTYEQPEVAGGIVVVAMLLRGVESLFQPLVLMVLADSVDSNNDLNAQSRRVQISWDCVFMVSVPATACLIFLAEPLLACWLGEAYRSLGHAFQIISLALPAALATVLLRGHLDAKHHFSPLAITNLMRIVFILTTLPLLNHWGALNIQSVAGTLAGLYWMQFTIIFWLLHRCYGTSIFSMTFFRYCCQKAVSQGGHR